MRLRRGLLLLLVFASACPIALASATPAAELDQSLAGTCDGASTTRTQDAIWLISTRHLACPSQYDPHNPDFHVMRYDWQTGWQDSEFEALLDTEDPQAVTAVFVHGYRIDWSTAFKRGMSAYGSLVHCVDDPRPIRFVIWSWPSAPTRGILRDLRTKAERCDCESHYLAWFLSRLNPDTRVGLFGFSFGSRIVSGALHLMGGGEMLGFGLADIKPKAKRKTRAVLTAGALRNYWLVPGYYHGRCLSQVDRMLVQYNPRDRLLRMLSACTMTQVLGYVGPPWRAGLGEDASRIEEQNVCDEVGDAHNMQVFFASPRVMSEIRQYVLWQ